MSTIRACDGNPECTRVHFNTKRVERPRKVNSIEIPDTMSLYCDYAGFKSEYVRVQTDCMGIDFNYVRMYYDHSKMNSEYTIEWSDIARSCSDYASWHSDVNLQTVGTIVNSNYAIVYKRLSILYKKHTMCTTHFLYGKPA